jgi:hypothetical protein
LAKGIYLEENQSTFMDRISALRNIEDALADFEAGETTLADLEGDVRGILRTYAADLEGELGAYRASGEGFEDVVVVAQSRNAACDRAEELLADARVVSVEPVE